MLRITLKGLLAHKIRAGLTGLAIVIGVAFVVGTMVLTDSLREFVLNGASAAEIKREAIRSSASRSSHGGSLPSYSGPDR